MDKICRCLLYYIMSYIVYTNASISITQKFMSEHFCPCFVEKAPNTTLMVAYQGGFRIKAALIVHRLDVGTKPKLKYSGKVDRFYTICMASPDIDADLKPELYREWDHWLTVNVPGSMVEKGDEVIPYVIPSETRKPDGTIPYVFVVHQQPGKLDIKAEHFNETIRQTGLFKYQDFVNKYNLTGPEWGIYFLLRNV